MAEISHDLMKSCRSRQCNKSQAQKDKENYTKAQHKLLKASNREKILKIENKRHIRYRGTKIRMTADFCLEMISKILIYNHPRCFLHRKKESEVAQLWPNSLRPYGLQPARFLHPWDFPGKDTRVGCHFLLQGIFLTQGQN